MSSTNGSVPENGWAPSADRRDGIERPYTPADVDALRGSVRIEHTLARLGAERLWQLLRTEPCVPALGAMTGGQAVQMVKAGLKSIYLSGWQVAADANLAGHTYPDQSLYPADSAPALVRRLNNALLRADQIDRAEGSNTTGKGGTHWLAPIVADAEAGFGGPLNAFELMKAMIEAGAAGVHFEDQLSSEKKCGHLGGKVLVPTAQHVRTLVAARLAADVLDVPTLVVARTDALSAKLLTSDVDETDAEFCTGERTPEGFFRVRDGLEPTIARALAYAPYCDLIWFETSTPDLGEAREFAQAVHERFPEQAVRLQLLAVVQLAQAPGRRRDRLVPRDARRARLPLPVRHPRRLPLAERGHVRARPRLRRPGDARLRRAPGTRVRARGARLYRHPPPARGRRRLLRPRARGRLRRPELDARAEGIDRRGPVHRRPRRLHDVDR